MFRLGGGWAVYGGDGRDSAGAGGALRGSLAPLRRFPAQQNSPCSVRVSGWAGAVMFMGIGGEGSDGTVGALWGRIPSHSPTDWPTPAVPAPRAGWVPQSVPAAVFRAGNCHSGPYRAITSLLSAAGQDSFFSMGSIADANRAVSFAIPSDGACCTARAWI